MRLLALFLVLAGVAFAQPALPSWVTAAYVPSSMVFSGSNLTGWNDISGNGHHITSVPAAPVKVTAGGEQWLDFSSSKYVTLPDSLVLSTQAGSVFVIAQSGRTTGSGNTVSMGDGLSGAGHGTNSDIMPNGALLNRTPNPTSSAANKMWTGFGWGLQGVVASPSAKTVYLETETKDLAASSAGTNTGGVIGRWTGNNSNYWNDGIKAAFIANRAINSTELAELRAYCQYYFRVGASSANAVIAVDGDSITNGGVNGAYTWALFMGSASTVGQSNLRPKFRNFATGGHTTAQILSGVNDPVLWLGDQTAFARKIYIVMGGTNSLGIYSLATVQSEMTSIVSAIHTAGFEAVVTTVLPTTSANADRDTFNAWLVAGGSGADQVVDLRAVTGLTNASDTTYFSDGTHPTSAGSKIIGDTVYAQLFPALAGPSFTTNRRTLLAQEQ